MSKNSLHLFPLCSNLSREAMTHSGRCTMSFVRPLTEEERTELKRMRRQEIGRVSLRAQIVLLSEQHWTVPQIAELLEMSRVTVRYWIERFESWGPAGL